MKNVIKSYSKYTIAPQARENFGVFSKNSGEYPQQWGVLGGTTDLERFGWVPPKMGGTQLLLKKDGTPQNGGYSGVPKGYSFLVGGTGVSDHIYAYICLISKLFSCFWRKTYICSSIYMPSPEKFSPPAVQINTLYVRIFKISRLRRKKRIYAQAYICLIRKKFRLRRKKHIYA